MTDMLSFGPLRLRVTAGRAKSDPGKLVTPGILYASKRAGNVSAHVVAVGWWDWHVSVLFARLYRSTGATP